MEWTYTTAIVRATSAALAAAFAADARVGQILTVVQDTAQDSLIQT